MNTWIKKFDLGGRLVGGRSGSARHRRRVWLPACTVGVALLILGLDYAGLATHGAAAQQRSDGTAQHPGFAATEAAAGTRLSAGSPSPCGHTTATPSYTHVIWIWMENHSYGQVMGSVKAPFENALAKSCGVASNYYAVRHPSLPNYLAATGGSTFGVSTDVNPAEKPIRAPSVFSEVAHSGRQWRSYVESMPGNCLPSDRYGFARNPAAYYTDLRHLCPRWDVPMGTPSKGALAIALQTDHLPAFSLMIPNLCHSTHSCSVATGDAWLSKWIDIIVRSPAYHADDTALFLTWDEGNDDIGQHIPLIVVSPTTAPGTVFSTRLNHYSLLRTTSELLHITPPGHAATATLMSAAFGLEPTTDRRPPGADLRIAKARR